MLLDTSLEVEKCTYFSQNRALHFCSLSLAKSPGTGQVINPLIRLIMAGAFVLACLCQGESALSPKAMLGIAQHGYCRPLLSSRPWSCFSGRRRYRLVCLCWERALILACGAHNMLGEVFFPGCFQRHYLVSFW